MKWNAKFEGWMEGLVHILYTQILDTFTVDTNMHSLITSQPYVRKCDVQNNVDTRSQPLTQRWSPFVTNTYRPHHNYELPSGKQPHNHGT